MNATILPEPRRLGKRCLCRTCGEFFNSATVFDSHRIRGECLSVPEMVARGWPKNPAGFWIERLHDETRAQARSRGQSGRLPAAAVVGQGVRA